MVDSKCVVLYFQKINCGALTALSSSAAFAEHTATLQIFVTFTLIRPCTLQPLTNQLASPVFLVTSHPFPFYSIHCPYPSFPLLFLPLVPSFPLSPPPSLSPLLLLPPPTPPLSFPHSSCLPISHHSPSTLSQPPPPPPSYIFTLHHLNIQTLQHVPLHSKNRNRPTLFFPHSPLLTLPPPNPLLHSQPIVHPYHHPPTPPHLASPCIQPPFPESNPLPVPVPSPSTAHHNLPLHTPSIFVPHISSISSLSRFYLALPIALLYLITCLSCSPSSPHRRQSLSPLIRSLLAISVSRIQTLHIYISLCLVQVL